MAEVFAELLRERVDDKAGIARSNVAGGLGAAFLVAHDVGQRRQAARDGMRTAGNALPEGNGSEDGHGENEGGKLADSPGVATAVCVMAGKDPVVAAVDDRRRTIRCFSTAVIDCRYRATPSRAYASGPAGDPPDNL